MTQSEQSDNRSNGGPGRLSWWIQRRANARTAQRIRLKGGGMMGMEVLVMHTIGRSSGEPRKTPLAWFADGEDSRLVVASGGGDHPDWYLKLMAHPERATIELHRRDPVPVAPEPPEGLARDEAWQGVAAAQPRIAKYQSKRDREYPVTRLRAVTKEAR